MNRVAAFALRRKNSILSMSEKMFCPPQPLRFWITPACAGKSPAIMVCSLEYWGSPPRVRGKAVHHKHRHSPGRITPACAGKSRLSACWGSGRWDHPRVCGEKLARLYSSVPVPGSPPRVRGKAKPSGLGSLERGITPACAGKRPESVKKRDRRQDHPRVCGEKFHPASDRKLGRVRDTKRSSGPAPAAAPAGLAGSCPASPPWSYPPRITVSRPRP